MTAWGGDSCNRSLKLLQPTPYDDSNESSCPITSSIEARNGYRFHFTNTDTVTDTY